MARIDLTKLINKMKVKNKTIENKKQNAIQSGYITTDFIKIPSWDEVKKYSASERMKSATDFALLNICDPFNLRKTEEGKSVATYNLRNSQSGEENSSLCTIGNEGDLSIGKYHISISKNGICPALELNLNAFLSARENNPELFNIRLSKNGKKHLLEMGEYPKCKVDKELENKLEELFNGGNLKEDLTCTGRLFTTNDQTRALYSYPDFLSKQYPEFEYEGQKYVRCITNKELTITDITWIKVEPITFKILNWDKLPRSINPKGLITGIDDKIELETDEIVLAGLPFYPDPEHDYSSLWQNSLIRAFLNSAKSSELDGNPEKTAKYQWDFSKNGFLYQAFDLTREPTKEFTIPENETKIQPFAFRGCVGLKKIIIPSYVTAIKEEAFKECVNTQLVFESLNKNLILNNNTLKGTNFKHFYISNDNDNTILSPYIDPELENSCARIDFNKERFSQMLNKNYRRNIAKVTNWKKEGKIKFIPPDYTLQTFPESEIEKYFVNNNSGRWAKLVKTVGFDKLEGIEKTNTLIDLMKIYYAIGGFSENQGESEKAYDYILNYVARIEETPFPDIIGSEIHLKFSRLNLNGPYNKTFAQFFMKYYKDNPNFMRLTISGDYRPKDYLCQAHNNFNAILKNYPNRVVNGNEERSLLTPEFVAEHSSFVEYKDVEKGNEELALLIGRYGYIQDQFEHIQDVYEEAKKIKDKYVIISDKSNESDPVQFRVLEKDDPLGFILGDITNCCQHIGGVGESCVDDGYQNPNAGFLVFEEKVLDENGTTNETRILGQAFVWYDPVTKTVCYDNIEIPTKVLDELRKNGKHEGKTLTSDALMNAVEKSAESIMLAMNRNGVKVERVTTGKGYNDLQRELSAKFKCENDPKAIHRNYNCYSDAKSAQYIIKTYDEVTKAYGLVVKDTVKDAIRNLEEIKEDISNRNIEME